MAKKTGCKRVSRKAAQRSVKGRTVLKKGCRYLKGDGAQCCPPGAKKKTARKGKGKRKRSGAASRARKGVKPNTPLMDRLNDWRREWKRAPTCRAKNEALRNIKIMFRQMATRPVSKKRGESELDARNRRWSRWQGEYTNKLHQTSAACQGVSARQVPRPSRDTMTVDGLKGHPCASARPPAWCNK